MFFIINSISTVRRINISCTLIFHLSKKYSIKLCVFDLGLITNSFMWSYVTRPLPRNIQKRNLGGHTEDKPNTDLQALDDLMTDGYIEERGINDNLFPFLQAWLYVKPGSS
ncbi:hypothetical protein HanXRQr2_Chr14g0660191 [Helianthus annuus]|uniref:Uncharacterized protein n=2 Tax=Helianthus annuus TaxID=4232 RepID=A0A9K3EAZ4_HELAN|nr:hypothetical protein HanXRQr2_Chr14g0660191 [Helianthus annuus]